MATSIGNWNVKINADISSFQGALKTASKLAGEFSRQFNVNQLLGSALGGADAKIAAFTATVRNMVSQIPYVGGALSAAATGGGEFAEFLTHSTKEMASNIKSADQLGIEYNDFVAIARKAGVESDVLVRVLQHLNVEIAKATAPGGDEAAKKFAGFGLDPNELRKADPSERLRLIADSYKNLTDSVQRSEELQFIGGRAGVQAGKAFAQGAEGIDHFKTNLTQVTKAQQEEIKLAAIQIKQAQFFADNLKTKATVEFAPDLGGFLKAFQDIGKSTGPLDFLERAAQARNNLIFEAQKLTLEQKVQLDQIREQVQAEADLQAQIELAATAEKERTKAANEQLRIAGQIKQAEGTRLSDLHEQQQTVFQLHLTGQISGGEAAKALDAIKQKQTEAGRALFTSTRSPLERFKEDTKDLEALLTGKFIKPDLAQSGIAAAFNKLKDATSPLTYNRIDAVEKNSAAAFSAENRFKVEGGRTVQEQVLEVLRQAKIQQDAQTEYQKEIAAALAGAPVEIGGP